MKTVLDQNDWDRICEIIETQCNESVKISGTPEEGYCIVFWSGVIHPAAFLDLFDESSENYEES